MEPSTPTEPNTSEHRFGIGETEESGQDHMDLSFLLTHTTSMNHLHEVVDRLDRLKRSGSRSLRLTTPELEWLFALLVTLLEDAALDVDESLIDDEAS